MDIKGKINIFKKEATYTDKEGKEQKRYYFVGSLSSKTEAGTYDNINIDVFFVKDLKEKSKALKLDVCYNVEVEKGFLSFKVFNYKETLRKDFYIAIEEAKILSSKEVTKKEKPQAKQLGDDLPF